MVMGLWQQTRQLRSWKPAGELGSNSLAFARAFAIQWRYAVAAVLVISLLADLSARSGLWQLDDQSKASLIFDFLYPVQQISLVVVLCNSVLRWSSASVPFVMSSRRKALYGMAGLLIATMVVIHGGLTTNMIHKGCAGIEAAQKLPYRRPGVYIRLEDEYFFSLWFAAAAVAALAAGGAVLIRGVRNRGIGNTPKRSVLPVILLLAIPVAFCSWYHLVGFQRLSPDLGGVGLEPTWVNWVSGLLVALVLLTAGSYRIARGDERTTLTPDLAHDIDRTAVHESVPFLLLIAADSLFQLAYLLIEIANSNSTVSSILGRQVYWTFLSMFWYPLTLLSLAQVIAGLQLCWIRWRRRLLNTPWEIYGVNRTRFCQSCVVIVVLLLIGIPTLNAFSFIAWLGPFDLSTLFGY